VKGAKPTVIIFVLFLFWLIKLSPNVYFHPQGSQAYNYGRSYEQNSGMFGRFRSKHNRAASLNDDILGCYTIDLCTSTIKMDAEDTDLRLCFRIISPSKTFTLQVSDWLIPYILMINKTRGRIVLTWWQPNIYYFVRTLICEAIFLFQEKIDILLVEVVVLYLLDWASLFYLVSNLVCMLRLVLDWFLVCWFSKSFSSGWKWSC